MPATRATREGQGKAGMLPGGGPHLLLPPPALTFRRIAVVSQETAVDLAGLNVLLH